MTLVHSGIPDGEKGNAHQNGWNYFLDKVVDHFGSAQKHPTASSSNA